MLVIRAWKDLCAVLDDIWRKVKGVSEKWEHLPAEFLLERLWGLAILDPFWFDGPLLAFIEQPAKAESPSALSHRAGTSLTTIERLRRGCYAGRPRADTWFKIVLGLGFAVPFLPQVDEYISENCRSIAQQRLAAQKQEVVASGTDVDPVDNRAPNAGDDGTPMLDDGTRNEASMLDDGTRNEVPMLDDGTPEEAPTLDDGTPKVDDYATNCARVSSTARAWKRRPMSSERLLLKGLREVFEAAFDLGCLEGQEGDASENSPSNSALTDSASCYSQVPGVDRSDRGEPIDGGPAMSRDDDENGKLVRIAPRIRFQGEEGYFVKSLPQTDGHALDLVREMVREVTVMQLQAFGQIHQLHREDMRQMAEAHREERRQERERSDALAMAYQKALTKMADTTADIATVLKAQREASARTPPVDWGKLLDRGQRLAAEVMKEYFGTEREESDG